MLSIMETTFDTKRLTLKSLVGALKGKSITELHQFAEKHFGRSIGQGAYRRVWKVQLWNRVVVLKIANNEDARWSNRKEMQVWNKLRKHVGIIARVFAHDKSRFNRWIISEFVPNPVDDLSAMDYFQISEKIWKKEICHFSGDAMVYYFENRKGMENQWYKELLTLK